MVEGKKRKNDTKERDVSGRRKSQLCTYFRSGTLHVTSLLIQLEFLGIKNSPLPSDFIQVSSHFFLTSFSTSLPTLLSSVGRNSLCLILNKNFFSFSES